MHTDLLIIGGGAAGMAAAREAVRRGIPNICLCERDSGLGGILPQCIHRGFGHGYFQQDLTGPEYAARFADALLQEHVDIRLNTTVLSLTPERQATLSSPEAYQTLSFDRLILATGCRERSIHGLPIVGTRPAGVLTAGAAQKMLNLYHWPVGQNIVILGSGDVGMIVARRLTLLGRRVVTMIEQSDKLMGLERNRRSCIDACQIPVLCSSTITQLHGWPRLCGVTVKSPSGTSFIPCDTLITAIGLIPEQELLRTLPTPPPDWLRLCGNCHHIHEIVDSVSYHAERCVRELFPGNKYDESASEKT